MAKRIKEFFRKPWVEALLATVLIWHAADRLMEWLRLLPAWNAFERWCQDAAGWLIAVFFLGALILLVARVFLDYEGIVNGFHRLWRNQRFASATGDWEASKPLVLAVFAALWIQECGDGLDGLLGWYGLRETLQGWLIEALYSAAVAVGVVVVIFPDLTRSFQRRQHRLVAAAALVALLVKPGWDALLWSLELKTTVLWRMPDLLYSVVWLRLLILFFRGFPARPPAASRLEPAADRHRQFRGRAYVCCRCGREYPSEYWFAGIESQGLVCTRCSSRRSALFYQELRQTSQAQPG